jgi:hypothetical protein
MLILSSFLCLHHLSGLFPIRVSQLKFCMHFWTLPLILHVSLTSPPWFDHPSKQHVVKSINYGTPHYAISPAPCYLLSQKPKHSRQNPGPKYLKILRKLTCVGEPTTWLLLTTIWPGENTWPPLTTTVPGWAATFCTTCAPLICCRIIICCCGGFAGLCGMSMLPFCCMAVAGVAAMAICFVGMAFDFPDAGCCAPAVAVRITVPFVPAANTLFPATWNGNTICRQLHFYVCLFIKFGTHPQVRD